MFGVAGSSDFPLIWAFANSLVFQLPFVVLGPDLLALVFGRLAFRSRVTWVCLAILTQTMTLGHRTCARLRTLCTLLITI